MKYYRTFRIDKLFHQLLKPKLGRRELLPELVNKLVSEGFIEVLQNRYIETPKMSLKEHSKELFKIVQEVINENESK